MGKACRERAVRDYAPDVQAGNYLNLYDDLLHQDQPPKPYVKNSSGSTDGMEADAAIPLAPTRAPLDTTLGSRFRVVYDNLLFYTLKSFAPHVHRQWNMSEFDRLKRLKQVKRLTCLLESCETDREARLEQLKGCEADREARLQQVEELTELLKTCETDRAARLDLINSFVEKSNSKKNRKQLDESLSELQIRDSEIEGLKKQLRHETQRALMTEQGWRALENTRVVRKARKVGLIKLEKMDFLKNDEGEK